jgi:hypothetical protein
MKKIAAPLASFIICTCSECMDFVPKATSLPVLYSCPVAEQFVHLVCSNCAQAACEMWSMNVGHLNDQTSNILRLLEFPQDEISRHFCGHKFNEALEQARVGIFNLALMHTPFTEGELTEIDRDFFDSLPNPNGDPIVPLDAEWFARAFQKVDSYIHNLVKIINPSLQNAADWFNYRQTFSGKPRPKPAAQHNPEGMRLFARTEAEYDIMDNPAGLLFFRNQRRRTTGSLAEYYDNVVSKTRNARLLYRRKRDKLKWEEKQSRVTKLQVKQMKVAKSIKKKTRRSGKSFDEAESPDETLFF